VYPLPEKYLMYRHCIKHDVSVNNSNSTKSDTAQNKALKITMIENINKRHYYSVRVLHMHASWAMKFNRKHIGHMPDQSGGVCYGLWGMDIYGRDGKPSLTRLAYAAMQRQESN